MGTLSPHYFLLVAQTSAINSSHPTPISQASSDGVLISRYTKDQVVGASSGQVLSTMTLADLKEYALTEGHGLRRGTLRLSPSLECQ